MTVYLVAHKGYSPSPANMCAWADYEGEANALVASIHVMSVKAFLKRRYAAEYIAKLPESVRSYREIVPFVARRRPRTRPKAKNDTSTRRKPADAPGRAGKRA